MSQRPFSSHYHGVGNTNPAESIVNQVLSSIASRLNAWARATSATQDDLVQEVMKEFKPLPNIARGEGQYEEAGRKIIFEIKMSAQGEILTGKPHSKANSPTLNGIASVEADGTIRLEYEQKGWELAVKQDLATIDDYIKAVNLDIAAANAKAAAFAAMGIERAARANAAKESTEAKAAELGFKPKKKD